MREALITPHKRSAVWGVNPAETLGLRVWRKGKKRGRNVGLTRTKEQI